jgi:hypothetical protein
VHFVSAGHLEGTIQKHLLPPSTISDLESDDASLALDSPTFAHNNTAAMAHMVIRSPSPAASEASSSGTDEVVFRGRKKPSFLPGPLPKPLQVAGATLVTEERTPFTFQATDATSNSTLPSRPKQAHEAAPPSAAFREAGYPRTVQLSVASTDGQTSVTAASVQTNIRVNASHTSDQELDSDADSVVDKHFAERRGGRPAWEGITTAWEHRSKPNIGWLPVPARPAKDAVLRGASNPRDAAMDDYMQNVKENGLTDDMMGASGFARREMDLDGGSHNEWESVSGSQQDEKEADEVGQDSNDDWDPDMMQDFDNMSTSSDVIDTVVRILSKRTRKSGLHYLCVYANSIVDDARWLPASFLNRAAEKDLVRLFEEEARFHELAMKDSDTTDGEEDDDDDNDEEEEEEELDDETIARVLQRQEELGLGSDEVLLYAGDEFFDGPFIEKGSSGDFSKENKKQQARVRSNRDMTFPSASAMADALAMDPYGGFDIMDTERPSLKQKKKGRRGQMPPELEDVDLNEQLQAAWVADRAKKRVKKAEREELRQQGLLGRKGKSANLSVKYSGGVMMDDVVEEIREFMFDDRQSLSLPPMDAHRRATIHQAATFFSLSSRSRGDGQDRFTILSKTSRTRVYTDDEFDKIVFSRPFFKRMRGPLFTQKAPGPAKGATFRSGKRVRPQIGYQDGEIVGANAPELGPENKGHALMMKMGWSKGMGLGTGETPGILQPIAHTVKTNKAGLQ